MEDDTDEHHPATPKTNDAERRPWVAPTVVQSSAASAQIATHPIDNTTDVTVYS